MPGVTPSESRWSVSTHSFKAMTWGRNREVHNGVVTWGNFYRELGGNKLQCMLLEYFFKLGSRPPRIKTLIKTVVDCTCDKDNPFAPVQNACLNNFIPIRWKEAIIVKYVAQRTKVSWAGFKPTLQWLILTLILLSIVLVVLSYFFCGLWTWTRYSPTW